MVIGKWVLGTDKLALEIDTLVQVIDILAQVIGRRALEIVTEHVLEIVMVNGVALVQVCYDDVDF